MPESIQQVLLTKIRLQRDAMGDCDYPPQIRKQMQTHNSATPCLESR